MKICAVQLRCQKGNVAANLEGHMHILQVAKSQDVDLVIFPELSLTGYEPELVKALAIALDDHRLDCFQQFADTCSITLLVGAPTYSPQGPRISLIIFSPGKAREFYSKRHLHKDEYPFFVPGDHFCKLHRQGHDLVPAICYESMLESHALEANQAGAQVYLASVAKDKKGVEKGDVHYATVARKHRMVVVMANCIGPSDNFVAYGNSAVWDQHGQCLAKLNEKQQGLVLYDCVTEQARIIDICH